MRLGPNYRQWPIEAQLRLRDRLMEIVDSGQVVNDKPRTIWVDVEHGGSRQIAVNKDTHRIRFQDETESEVVIVIEPKQ